MSETESETETETDRGETVAAETAPAPATDTAVARMPRAVVLASLVGALVGFVVVTAIAVLTHAGARHYSDDFFDAQARAWLGGHWDVPAEVVGGEGFATPHGTQIYFGVAPALARVPILLVTSAADGHLALVSELVALAVLALVTARFAWAVRTRLTDEPPSRTDVVLAGLLVTLVTGCSSATYLAGQPTVFSEAILWSAALLVASIDQVLRLLAEPSRRRAVLAAAFAGLALNTRVTTGLGGLAAIGLLSVLALRGKGRWAQLRPCVVPIVAVVAVSFVVCFGANVARFGHPWKIPYEEQVVYRFDPARLAVFQSSSGPFSPGYLQTDLFAYLRPDGARLGPGPFASFPDPRDTIVGPVPPNIVEPTASVPVAMPALALLSGIGIAVLVRGRDRARLRDVGLPLLGAAVPAVFLFDFASLAHRYSGDLVPLLVVLASVGTAWVGLRPRRAVRTALLGGLVLLGLWGAWVTVNLAVYTNERNSLRSRPVLESWTGMIADTSHRLGGTIPQPAAPPTEPAGWDLVARPDCARVYTAYFDGWYAFERAPGTGAFHLRVEPPPADGEVHPLVETAGGRTQVGLRRVDDGVVAAVSRDGGTTWTEGSTIRGMRADGTRVPQPLPVGDDGRVDVVVDLDTWLNRLTVSGDAPETLLVVQDRLDDTGRASLVGDFPGAVAEVDDGPARCAAWTRTG